MSGGGTIQAEMAFSSRGLDIELAAKLGASYAPGKYRFEYRKAGKLLFTKVRTDDKQFWIEPAGQRLQFWGLDEVPVLSERPVEPLVLTEGEFDRIAVLQACGGYALSVPNGTSGKRTEGQVLVKEDTGFSYLWDTNERIVPQVDQFNKIILFTDADEAGFILRDELAMRLGQSRCWFIPFPEGHKSKDANDLLRDYGPDVLRRAIAAAKPIRPGSLVSLTDLPPREKATCYDTGWEWLNPYLRLVRPSLVVVSGIPNHGKGVFVRALCANLALRHGLKTAFLVPEDPPERVRRDFLKFAMGKFGSSAGYNQEAGRRWMGEHFRVSLPPDDEPITLDFVEAEMASAALHHGCGAFVVDPWNELHHDFAGLTETQYIERALVRLKKTARRYNLLLIVVGHPRKVDAGAEPSLYTISGTANWKNKADHGIIIHRLTNPTTGVLTEVTAIIIEKSKDYETMGHPGRVTAKLDTWKFDYVPLDAHVEEVAQNVEQPADGIPF